MYVLGLISERVQGVHAMLLREFLCLTLFDMGLFEPSVMEGGISPPPPHHNLLVIAPIIVKFGTGVKLDVFYTMVTKIVTSLLLRHYDVITFILANR